MESAINAALLSLLAAVAFAIVRQRSLFGVVILFGIYSFLMATVMLVLDAPDVALTEAAVGAGVSTVLFLAALHLTRTIEMRPFRRNPVPLLLAVAVAGLIVWGARVLPPFGIADSPVHTHVAPRYLSQSIEETGVPNVVTAVLADYRSYDTLGEAVVIFAAGIGVMLLLRGARRRDDHRGRRPQ